MPAFEITEQLLASLPEPIAIPARRYRDETDPRSKLLLLVDTVETVFKFGSAIALREMLRTSNTPNEKLSAIKEEIMAKMGGTPTLGNHVEIIRKICDALQKSHQISSIIALIKPLVGEKLASSLTSNRNDYKGHGAVPTLELSKCRLDEMAGNFGELLKRAAAIHNRFPCCSIILDPSTNTPHMILKDSDNSIYLDLYPFFLIEPAVGEFSIIYNGRKRGKNVLYLNYKTADVFVLYPGQEPADAFNAEFPPAPKKDYDLPNQEPASELIEDRIRSFRGREVDLAFVNQFMDECSRQVLVVTGAPGQGKTSLICKWLGSIAAQGKVKQLVIRHFVMEGDAATCSTTGIFRSLCAQLGRVLKRQSLQKPDWKAADWQQEFHSLLHQASQKFDSVVVVIDGLDEAERHRQSNPTEESILQWLPAPSLSSANIRWLISIRPQYLLDPAFRAKYGEDKAIHHELGKLDANAIRAILHDHACNWHEVALRDDLVETILERSEGSPIYIHQLACDLEDGRLNFSEAGIATIPNGMVEFHGRILEEIETRISNRPSNIDHARIEIIRETLCDQLKIGEISQDAYERRIAAAEAKIRSSKAAPAARVLGLLAVCLEPLSVASLAKLMEISQSSLQETLEDARSVLSESYTSIESENSRYSLYHSSFREFFLQRRPEAAQWGENRFKEICSHRNLRKDEYVIRHGASHLVRSVQAKRTDDAVRELCDLLTDLDFITVKIRAGMVPELLQDYEQALTCLTGSPSSMFHGLEVDGEDRSWIFENHLARREGRPLPFPGRGGDLVTAAIKERLEMRRTLEQAKKVVCRLTNISQGLDPDFSPGWDLYEEAEDDTKQAGNESAPLREVPQGTAEELALAVQERDLIENQIQTSQQAYRNSIFPVESATARAVAKMLSAARKSDDSSPVAHIEAFRIFVGGMWEKIADKAFSVPDLCVNYRDQGMVREAGLSSRDLNSIRIENLYPPTQDVMKIQLPFKHYGVDDETAEVCFFDSFKMCLRVVISNSGRHENHYTFEVIDVTQNKIRFTTQLKLEIGWGGYPEWRTLRVSEDGRFGRFYNSYFKIDSQNHLVELLSSAQELPEIHALQLRHAELDVPHHTERKCIRVTSDDSALSLITGTGRSLNLFGSFTEAGQSLNSDYLCCDGKRKIVSFSEDGRLVFANTSDYACVVDLISWTRIFSFAGNRIEVAHTPDGRLLATDSGGEIKVWDLASGRILRRFLCDGKRAGIHFSRSGELLHVRGFICDLRTGSIPPSGNRESNFRYSMNDGHSPVIGELDGEPKHLLAGNDIIVAGEYTVACGSFRPDGIWSHSSLPVLDWPTPCNPPKRPECDRPALLSPTQSKNSGLILLPMGSGILHVMNSRDGVIRILSDEDYLSAMDVTVGEKMIQRYIESPWERDRRESMERWEESRKLTTKTKIPQFYINAALISDDGLWILTATNWDALRIWDAATGRCVRDFPLPPAENHFAGHVEAISLTPDGLGCYLALRDGTTHLLDCWQKSDRVWKMVMRLDGPVEVYCRAFQNRRFAHRYRHELPWSIHEIHDLSTKSVISLTPLNRLFVDMDFGIHDLLIAPDNHHLIVAHEETLVVLTLEGLQEITRFSLPSKVRSLSNMTPDGRFVVHTEANGLLRLKLKLPEF